jgi:WD40 repeat protein
MVRDLGSRELLHTLEGHENRVNDLAILPDGCHVISCSLDKTLKLWELETGGLASTLEGHNGAVLSVAVTPNGTRAASASSKSVKIWDLTSLAAVPQIGEDDQGHEGKIFSVKVSGDGRRAVSLAKEISSPNNTIKLWDLKTYRVLKSFDAGGSSYSVALSTDGAKALFPSWNKQVKLIDLTDGEVIQVLEDPNETQRSVALTPDCRRAITGRRDIRLWDLESGVEIHSSHIGSSWVWDLAVTPDGRRLVFTYGRGLRVWDIQAWEEIAALEAEAIRGSAKSLALSAEGKLAVSGHQDGKVMVWNLKRLELQHTLTGHDAEVLTVALASNGRFALSGAADRTLRIWDIDRGHELARFLNSDRITACDVTPDLAALIVGDGSGKMHFFKLENVETDSSIMTPSETRSGPAV